MSKGLIKFCKDLINIPTYEREGQKEMSNFLSAEFQRIGFDVMIDKFYNTYATKRFGGQGSLLINAHLDTVPPSGLWTRNPLVPKIQDGRLYGLGAADDKGAIASIYDAVRNLEHSRFKNVEILLSNHEEMATEVGQEMFNGTTLFLMHHRKKVKSKIGINMEPTFLHCKPRIAIGHTGGISFDLSIYGKQCHSSLPSKGINAISQACEVIRILEEHNKEETGNGHSGALNVGVIQGGTYRNVVPGTCQLQCLRRILPTEDITAVESNINNLMQNSDFKYKLKVRKRAYSYSLEEDTVIVRLLKSSVAAITGKEAPVILYNARTDAFLLNKHADVKTVIFGPGDLDQAHSPDEYVCIEDLEITSKILKNCLKR